MPTGWPLRGLGWQAQSTDTTRTLIYSGRPLRVYNSPYVAEWNDHKAEKIKELTGKGVLPAEWDRKRIAEVRAHRIIRTGSLAAVSSTAHPPALCAQICLCACGRVRACDVCCLRASCVPVSTWQSPDEELDLLGWIPDLMGQGAGAVHEVMPAAAIIEEMMEVASEILAGNASMVAARL